LWSAAAAHSIELVSGTGPRETNTVRSKDMTEHVTTQALRADLANVMRDAEALMKASAGHGGEKVDEARTRILESLESAKRRLLEVERSAVRHGEEAVAATENYVKSNPWQSVGIAAGVGLILGVLLARR
jgi:ElaB/YqjD/DUF883 family membrane-anchored ribosome-binding protein